VISGRLSRFTVSGSTISGPETVLIEDWCQQFPSHSIGDIGFGPDGALYVSGGDGASFNGVDYGQLGGTLGPTTPKNPCGDPPNDAMTPPTAEGGALRSQDLRTDGPPTGSGYQQAVLADGPVAYWRLGETSGTLADDAVGSNDGTYTGGFTLGQPGALAGDSNTAITLNGSSGYVNVGNKAALRPANVTFEAWVKPSTVAPDDSWIGGVGNTGFNGYSLAMQNNVGQLKWTVRNGSSSTVSALGPSIAAGTWHHVVGTHDGSQAKLYVDGVLEDVRSAPFALGYGVSVDFYLGAFDLNALRRWPGSLDEVAIYSTALSATQIAAHYAAGITP
jgi:hypothetical protein